MTDQMYRMRDGETVGLQKVKLGPLTRFVIPLGCQPYWSVITQSPDEQLRHHQMACVNVMMWCQERNITLKHVYTNLHRTFWIDGNSHGIVPSAGAVVEFESPADAMLFRLSWTQ